MLYVLHRIRDNANKSGTHEPLGTIMARKTKPTKTPKPTKTGIYYARQARKISRSELVRLSGVSKQQLSRLENGQIRMRLDHLKPFAPHLGYTPEQILLWGRLPHGVEGGLESGDQRAGESANKKPAGSRPVEVRELDARAPFARGRVASRFKAENWV